MSNDYYTENSNNKKFNRLVSFAADQSLKSTVSYRHGAVIYQGKKKICSGYNQNSRSIYKNNHTCSIHAEMDTVVKFLNSFAKIHNIKNNPDKLRRKMHKYSICVVRTVLRTDGTIECMNSLPCRDCLTKLKMVGLNKVSFTGSDNQIFTAKIKNIEISHIKYTGVMRKNGMIENTRISNLLL